MVEVELTLTIHTTSVFTQQVPNFTTHLKVFYYKKKRYVLFLILKIHNDVHCFSIDGRSTKSAPVVLSERLRPTCDSIHL